MPDPSTPPYSEATVELVAQVVRDERGCFSEVIAERVLDALAAAGRLLPEGAESRTEWGVRLVWDDGRPDDVTAMPDHAAAVGRFRYHKRARAHGNWLVTPHILRRTITEHAGPWSAVPPEPDVAGS